MIEYSQLVEIMKEQQVSESEQELVREFLMTFSYLKRQQLMGIFLGFPDKIAMYIKLLVLKSEFAKKPSDSLAKEITDMESGEIKNLIKELGQ
jgi:hypothetical protein